MSTFAKILRGLLWLTLSAGCGGLIIVCGSVLYLSPKLPAVELIRDIELQIPLRVYTADGYLIGEFGEKKRTPITFDQIPQAFINAILAAEDARFFSHPGVDIKGLTRAALELVSTGSIQSGGSTITMQVAKNYFLSSERTFLRKFNEILLAIQMERELSKQEIMELYVNKIYLGHRAYGVEAAANVYYARSIDALTVAELAMLAGLPKAPSANNPVSNPKRALQRRNWILGRMHELGFLDATTYQSTVNEPITARLHTTLPEVEADYLAEMVRQEMLDRFGLEAYTKGYKAYTTLRKDHQKAANRAVQQGLMAYDQRHGYRGPLGQHPGTPESDIDQVLQPYRHYGPLHAGLVMALEDTKAQVALSSQQRIEIDFDNAAWARPYINLNQRGPEPTKMQDILQQGDVIYVHQDTEGAWHLSQLPALQSALVSLRPGDGALLALVGGYDFQASKFNRAIQAGRQAGSSFKPFVYTSALTRGFTAATMINDAPVVFEDAGLENTWRPANEGGQFRGPTRLREALYRSRNLVSIRVLRAIGVRNVIKDAVRFGFPADKLPPNLSLALGSAAFTPLEMATAYAIFANGGFRIEPWFLAHVIDNDDNPVYQHQPLLACRPCELNESMRPLKDNDTAPPEAENSNDDAAWEHLLAEARNDQLTSTPDTAFPDMPVRLAPRVLDERNHYIINSMLQDVIRRGTGVRAKALQRNDLAGKTGTTNDQRDVWFAGYNQDVVTTVWAGFDVPEPLGRREFGSTVALPIWIDFMRVALQNSTDRQFPQPSGIVTARIDAETGKLATSGSTEVIFEVFREETVPEADPQDVVPNPYAEESLPEQLF